MAVKVGINGFGRIGRNIMRAAMGDRDIEFVAVNDLTNAETLAHLLKYDSVLGNLQADVAATGDGISGRRRQFKVLSVKDPAQLPWKDLGVDVVFESTGLFTKRDDAAKHLAAGAKKVIITAPAKGPDITRRARRQRGQVRPGASTTSSRTPRARPTAWRRWPRCCTRRFGIRKGWMTTIHSYTNDQQLLDLPHKDLRRARAAALSIIPTTTGAAEGGRRVLPELKGKLDGIAMRVPTPNVSVVDLAVIVDKKTIEAKRSTPRSRRRPTARSRASCSTATAPLVSIDFSGNPHSSIVDAPYTKVMDGDFVKVLSWYDNEWGYSNRCVDLLRYIVKKGL